jgi:hypothetical protein
MHADLVAASAPPNPTVTALRLRQVAHQLKANDVAITGTAPRFNKSRQRIRAQ